MIGEIMNGKNILEFPRPETNHNCSKSKYLELQKWCNVDTNIYVSGDAIATLAQFRSLLRGLHGKKFDCQQPFNTNQPTDKASTHRHIA